jgi:cobalamin biosynthesis Co2+ chelatase CbiK
MIFDKIPEIQNKLLYKSNEKIFYNSLDALTEASKTGKSVEFFLDFAFISNTALWQSEPTDHIHKYLEKHALILANKYDQIIIQYSGGTDSQTILDAFIRAGVKNVILWNRYSDDNKNSKIRFDLQKSTHNSLKQKYSSIIKELNYSVFGLEDIYLIKHGDEKDWEKTIDNFSGDWNRMISSPLPELRAYHNKHTNIFKNHKNSCVVWGLEKPNLVLDNNWWCWQTNSSNWFSASLPTQNQFDNVFFFVTDDVPEIQIKLSWLKIKKLEQIIQSNNYVTTNKVIENLQSFTNKNYTQINESMGYKALNSALNSNMTKPGGLVFDMSLVETQKTRNSTGISSVTKKYFDEVVCGVIDKKFLIESAAKTIPIMSKKIPIKPVQTS